MGLAERRALKEFQENVYPDLKDQVDKAAGFEVDMSVDWDTLALDDQAHLYNECFAKVYFEPLVGAFKSVCGDDMGREALKGGLSKISIRNTLDKSSPSGFTFEAGVLTLDHKPTTNVGDISARTKALVSLLEKGL
jgi:hypothetical protein